MFKYVKIPKIQMTLCLVLIYLSVLISEYSIQSVYIFLTSVAFAVSIDLLFLKLRKIALFFPYAAIVSGVIISLVLLPTTPLPGILLVCLIAMLGKNFLRFHNRHIFNPAAFGLVVGCVLLKEPISWWAVSLQNILHPDPTHIILFLPLVLPFTVSGIRMKRFYSILSFFVAYALLSAVFFQTNTFNSLLSVILNPTFIFFSVVMLPEPVTTPVRVDRQIFFGIFVACISIIMVLPGIGKVLYGSGLLLDPFLLALLIGNAVFYRFK